MNITVSQQENITKQLSKLLSGKKNATRRSVTQSIVGYLGHCGEAYPSQTTLGNRAHVVRETVNRSIKSLDGLILVKSNRGYKKTCRYWLTTEFLNNRHHFYDLIPALRQINLILLFSITSNVYSQNVTQYKELKGAQPRSRFSFVQFKPVGYGFYEEGYSEVTINQLFINNKQQTTSIRHQPLKGESIMNKSVINLIADTYGLSVDQEERLNNCSTEGLEYAVKEFARQKQTTTINNPVNWIAKVAAAYKGNAPRFPKNGKEIGHAAQSRNSGGHSPSGDASNLSHNERTCFALGEESAWSEIFEPTPELEALGIHEGYAQRAQANWKRIAHNPNEFPTSSNSFKDTIAAGEQYTEGEEYEEHLNQISADKTDPEAYKRRTRISDYRRIARK